MAAVASTLSLCRLCAGTVRHIVMIWAALCLAIGTGVQVPVDSEGCLEQMDLSLLKGTSSVIVENVASTTSESRYSAATVSGDSSSTEGTSLLQKPAATIKKAMLEDGGNPHLISLRRESVPIYRRGKVASFKTSYSGTVNVGNPPQEFRVVFDTGSAHVVLPAVECRSESCRLHRTYNMTASSTALPINTDGSIVPVGELCDQVVIGFGTGQITGEFVQDKVCFSLPDSQPAPPTMQAEELDPSPGPDLDAKTTDKSASSADRATELQDAALARDADFTKLQGVAQSTVADLMPKLGAVESERAAEEGRVQGERAPLCVDMHVVLAVEMSNQPFKSFLFDGIMGLSLDGLALTSNFSAFDMLIGGSRLGRPHFGVFLTEGEEGEENELAIGGHNVDRVLEPLTWAPVAMADIGYWQVRIVAVRIDGKELEICRDGTCRGVVDTGTSHLGVPAPHDGEWAELLTKDAGDLVDCRLVVAPVIEIEVEGYNLTLHPFNYMRRLPLREGISVGSQQGVYIPSNDTNATLTAPSSADAMPVASISTDASTRSETDKVRRHCRPRLMPVRLPPPLGPKLFILGEPVLHRYYTVFDWEKQEVGFGLANNHRNNMGAEELEELRSRGGTMPKEVDMLLMQTRRSSFTERGRMGGVRQDVLL